MSVAQQASRGLERSRDLLVKQHTQLTNCIRGQLAELGLVAAQGRRGFVELAGLIEAGDARIPEVLLLALPGHALAAAPTATQSKCVRMPSAPPPMS